MSNKKIELEENIDQFNDMLEQNRQRYYLYNVLNNKNVQEFMMMTRHVDPYFPVICEKTNEAGVCVIQRDSSNNQIQINRLELKDYLGNILLIYFEALIVVLFISRIVKRYILKKS